MRGGTGEQSRETTGSLLQSSRQGKMGPQTQVVTLKVVRGGWILETLLTFKPTGFTDGWDVGWESENEGSRMAPRSWPEQLDSGAAVS